MKERYNLSRLHIDWWGASLLPLLLFWVILSLNVSPVLSQYFHLYSFGLFLIVLLLFFISFQQTGKFQILAPLGLIMALFALSLSYVWTSGWSDNGIIGGLLPYKDPKNYYFGAKLILNGLPVIGAQQATERPLFPAFLASVLFLTDENLKITIAAIVQFMGLGLYLTARQVRNLFGPLPASLYAALLYFYILPWIGYLMSETLGFAAGCFGFALILVASRHLRLADLVLGLITLLVAVSARAGTFIIFPLLVIWTGWAMRGQKQFSLKAAGSALIITLVGYFLVNSIHARFLGIPPGASFTNFSYALYGQVRGGLGWHNAIVELGTRDSSVVYRAAWEYFREHPSNLFIGFLRAYQDFFLFGGRGIFSFFGDSRYAWLDFSFWLAAVCLIVLGLAQLIKDLRSNLSALLLAGFIGIFLSIPFLPPVDGGVRFYASTVPFFFAIPAIGLGWLSKSAQQKMVSSDDLQAELAIPRFVSITMVFLILFLPHVIHTISYKPAHVVPACAPDQKPFVIEFDPGSYIDVVQTGSSPCGSIPQVCLPDFQNNNDQKASDDFYQRIFQLIENTPANVRLIAGFDLVAERLHYYFISHDKLPENLSPGLISGCAVRISTRNQTIFQVETILPK